jgi:hypothetical protein
MIRRRHGDLKARDLVRKWGQEYKFLPSLCEGKALFQHHLELGGSTRKCRNFLQRYGLVGKISFPISYLKLRRGPRSWKFSLAQLFPGFVEEEDNRSLMEEVSKEELKEALHSFQKEKILGLDGWPIEFFLGIYDVLGQTFFM